MNYIYYQIHLILQHKNKLFILLVLYLLFFIFTYKLNNIAHCMTEGDIEKVTSQLAESKNVKPYRSNIEQLIHREVTSYLETAQIIETKDQAIVTLEAENKQLKHDLRMLAKNYLRTDYDRHELLGLTTHLDPVSSTDPFYQENNLLIESLKRQKPFIFEEGGFDPENEGTNEQERGVPDLLHYGDVENPINKDADY